MYNKGEDKMANWKYDLRGDGILLRQLIKEEKEPEIIEQLQKCYQVILKKLTPRDKENYEYEVEEASNLLDGEADILKNNPDVIINEWDFNNTRELVNSRLQEFYNICDDVRCWVAL